MKIASTSFSGAFIHTRCVHDRGQGQPAQHTQAERSREFGSNRQERSGSGAGDQQEDHHVVQTLQPATRQRTPVAAVIQRADPEQSGQVAA